MRVFLNMRMWQTEHVLSTRACNNLDGRGRLTGITSNEMELGHAWTINYIFVLIGTFLIAIVGTPLVRSLAFESEQLIIQMQDVSIKSQCRVLVV